MNIGLRIKGLREEKNMSQEELADKIGVSKQMVSHYENGINVPRGKKIKLLAKVFGITEEEFYTSQSTSNLTDAQKPSGVPLETFLEVANELRDLNKDLNQRLKNEIAYEREIKELRLKIQELEFLLRQG
jgi:transcriptional regulator with XRE-family HTH domain